MKEKATVIVIVIIIDIEVYSKLGCTDNGERVGGHYLLYTMVNMQ